MRCVCISSSNIKHATETSTSTKACKIIKEIIHEEDERADVEIVRLVDHDLLPCVGCGGCFARRNCVHDDHFNEIYSKMVTADGLFIVTPHYAPIPAKLSMVLEKIEQIAFLRRFRDETYRSPLYGKPAAIVAHGGGTEEIMDFYDPVVIAPVANALMWPVEMDIVKYDERWTKGVAFPVKSVRKAEDSIFPIQEYDWLGIKKRLVPMVHALIKAVNTKKIRL